ncbi:hypothetical protein CcaverHIS631_0408730 [Cutaneotrichosporon cavernicola]|nr:hypothetical protein CcaverHIS631_0408730 [Cutaneotrichosporon cavernicola]
MRRTAVLYRQLQIETSQLPAPVAEKPVWFDAAFDARFTRTVQPRLDANKTPFVRLDRGMRQLLILSCPRRARGSCAGSQFERPLLRTALRST